MSDELIISENNSTYRRVSFVYRNGNSAGYKTISFKIRSSMQKEDFDNKILTEYKRKIEEYLKEEKVTIGEIKLLNFQIEICAEIHAILNLEEKGEKRSQPVLIDKVIHELERVIL